MAGCGFWLKGGREGVWLGCAVDLWRTGWLQGCGQFLGSGWLLGSGVCVHAPVKEEGMSLLMRHMCCCVQ